MRRISALALVVASLAPAGRAEPAGEASPREVFQAAQRFLVRGGGRWVSANRRYEAGGPGPRWFGLEFEWAPEPHAVLGRIFAIAEDGTLRQLWTLGTV